MLIYFCLYYVVQSSLLWLLGVEPDYLLYSEVSLHWTPVRNVAATPPVIFALQRGSSGGRLPKLKIDVKLPCKML